jgi:hypothetical protein
LIKDPCLQTLPNNLWIKKKGLKSNQVMGTFSKIELLEFGLKYLKFKPRD